jgi:histidyl-tRNA synthetase
MFFKIRGTRDIINTNEYEYILNVIKKRLKKHLFLEIYTPIIESLKLFSHTLGENTDILSKEIYLVSASSQSKNEEETEKICLRPEATTSIMRCFLEQNPIKNPWRVFTFGSMFRHERPQKGRYREFYQCSIEMINANSEYYDIELIYILENIFKDLGLKSFYKLKLNFIGDINDRNAYINVLVEYLNSIKSLIPEKYHQKINNENVFKILDAKDKDPELKKNLNDIPKIIDYLSNESSEKWFKIKNLLNYFNIDYEYDSSIIRGLDYYNDIIFEFKTDLLGSQDTFCGGGRYNGLSKILGSKDNIPSIGAGIGVDRLVLMLNEKNLIKKENLNLIAIISQDSEYLVYGMELLLRLIEEGCFSEIYADKISFKSAFRKADTDKAVAVCIIGDIEYKARAVSIKILSTGEQITMPFEEAIKYCINKWKI